MRHLTSPIGVFAIACALLANAGSARAATHTWVSATGTNTGICPVTAPCRTLHYALTQTVAGGVISVLSSGDYFNVTIDKSINIVAEGVEANTAGITVNAPGGVVVLRGLSIQPSTAAAQDGILFVAGAALHVYNCFIGKNSNGIKFSPASGTSELSVVDSTIADTTTGFYIIPTGSGSAKVMIDRVRVNNAASIGIYFYSGFTTGSVKGTVRDSVSEGASSGVYVVESGGGTSNVMIDRSALVNNTSYGAIAIGAGATIRIGDSVVTGNNYGLYASGGVVQSYGTNKVNGNTNDGTPTPVAYK